MSLRILLADDSAHAQRLGSRILMEEGFEVELAPDGHSTYAALDSFNPEVVIVDVFLPQRSGYEVCHWIKSNPRYQSMRVVITAGLLEPIDEVKAQAAGCDGIIKKPFEASEVIRLIRPLAEAAHFARGLFAAEASEATRKELPAPNLFQGAVAAPSVDPERIRAAVTVALEAAMPAMIKEVTERVLIALGH